VIEHGSWNVSERMPYLWSSDIEALIALNRLDDAPAGPRRLS
jgi:hypothetical protein